MYIFHTKHADFIDIFMDKFPVAKDAKLLPKMTRILANETPFEITEKKHHYQVVGEFGKKTFTSLYGLADFLFKASGKKIRPSMKIRELKQYVIRPALSLVNLWSQAAENLLAGTILAESGAEFLKQINGPALGIYQIEPDTHTDVKRQLVTKGNKQLYDTVLNACYLSLLPANDALVWHLRYATIVARLIYRRAEEALPDAHDTAGLARYHKLYYNTLRGKADPRITMQQFERACL